MSNGLFLPQGQADAGCGGYDSDEAPKAFCGGERGGPVGRTVRTWLGGSGLEADGQWLRSGSLGHQRHGQRDPPSRKRLFLVGIRSDWYMGDTTVASRLSPVIP